MMNKETKKDEEPSTELTMRDHFAIAALTGLVAGGHYGNQDNANWVLALTAYDIADDMMKARDAKS